MNLFQECLLGRAEGCDIRIQLPIVSKEHAKLKVQVTDGAVSSLKDCLRLWCIGYHLCYSGQYHRAE